MHQFTMSFPPVTDADIDAVETNLELTLPDDYRRFLSAINGGLPESNRFYIPAAQDWSFINFLYGISGTREFGDLENEQWGHRERGSIEPGVLVIGNDPGGNLLLLGTEGDTRGRVYYWDAVYLCRTSNEEDGNTYKLAPTFQAFLDGLSPEE